MIFLVVERPQALAVDGFSELVSMEPIVRNGRQRKERRGVKIRSIRAPRGSKRHDTVTEA
jgi:hypothetical protein